MILVDINEPQDIIDLLGQVCTVMPVNLNTQHMSDFFFSNYDGKTFQFSRKQAGELMGDIDEAEDQIKDYYPQADENFQIVEGIISPIKLKGVAVRAHMPKGVVSTRDMGSKVYCYSVNNGGDIGVGHSFNTRISVYYAWRHRLEQCGVTTYETLNSAETAKMLGVIYLNEQKPVEEHSTLNRIIRPRMTIRNADPLVVALVFLSKAYKLNIGETTARAIAKKFVSITDIAQAGKGALVRVEGIGPKMADRIIQALGGLE